MKARQPEFRAIQQFDSGRWKWRLERVPVDPGNETTMGVDFDAAVRARVNESNEAGIASVAENGGTNEKSSRLKINEIVT